MQRSIYPPLLHRNSECIGIYFDKNTDMEKIIRRQPAVKWSQTNKCWYIPLTETAYRSLIKDLEEKATVDNAALKAYLEKKRKVTAGSFGQTALPVKLKSESKKMAAPIRPVAKTAAWQLSTANLKALENFVQHLQLKAYSNSTINTYRNEFLQLLKILKKKPVDELTTADLKRYMVYAMEKRV